MGKVSALSMQYVYTSDQCLNDHHYVAEKENNHSTSEKWYLLAFKQWCVDCFIIHCLATLIRKKLDMQDKPFSLV